MSCYVFIFCNNGKTHVQPSYELAEATRCIKSRGLLHSIAQDTRSAEVKLAKLNEKCSQAEAELPDLERQLEELMEQIEARRKTIDDSRSAQVMLKMRMAKNASRQLGLCIRMLNRDLLTCVLRYVVDDDKTGDGDDDGDSNSSRDTANVRGVCDSWRQIADDIILSRRAAASSSSTFASVSSLDESPMAVSTVVLASSSPPLPPPSSSSV